MRKIFMGTMFASFLSAIVIGGALAWTGSATTNYAATSGSISVALANAAYTSNQIYPTGSTINLVSGQIQNNTAANPGVAVAITGGTLTNFSSDNGVCNAWLALGGAWTGSVGVSDGSAVNPGGNVGGGWVAGVSVHPTMVNDCQNKNFTYDVTINVTT
ncbi:MAG: hypothetical protein M9925_16985 [Chloroflexi bacterium]|nr:hypothetical protein [Chloroflexota bacterium]